MENGKGIIDKKSAKDFAHCVCLAFAMQVAVSSLLMFFSDAKVAEEQAKISSIYAHPGCLSKETIAQFLLVAILTGIVRHIFCSDRILKIQSVAVRISAMFGVELVIIALAAWKFQWIHSANALNWLGFAIGALPCVILGFVLTYRSERKENAEMNEALHKVQENENE